jgi:hypothetical protein
MHSANHWGGSFEIYNGAAESTTDDEKSRNMEWDKAALQPQRHHLDETQQSWLLYRQETKKKKYVDFGCIACSHRALKWTLYAFVFAVLVILLPTVLAKTLPKHRSKPSPPDNYTLALHKALLFFNAQKCKSSQTFPLFFSQRFSFVVNHKG